MSSTPRRRTVLATGVVAATVVALDGCTSGDGQEDRPDRPEQGADLVLTGGRVHTLDDKDSVHQALAVSGGRIAYVGTDQGARRHIGKRTEVVELRGRMVMPGLHDGHLHPMSGGQGLLGCDLEYAPLTVKQFQDRIRAYLKETADDEKASPDTWVQVEHWYAQAMRPAGTKVTKAVLDALDTRRPIIVKSTDGHTVLVNSRALEIAGITAKTKDPSNGAIARDAKGEPTGVLEDGASDLVEGRIPKPTAEDNLRIARTALAALAEQGVTTFMDAMASEEAIRAFATLAERGELTARGHFAPLVNVGDKDPIGTVTALRERYDGGDAKPAPTIAVRNTKLFLDGVLQYPAQTAGLLQPYLECDHGACRPGKKTGAQYWKQDQLDDIVGKLTKAGFDPHIHAIGDRSVRLALNAFAKVREGGDRTSRLTVAHAELVDPADIKRFGRLDVVAAMGFHWAKPAPDSVESVRPYLGSSRWSRYEPEGDIFASGGRISLGSDWPVDPLDEWTAIKTAITRTAEPGSPYAKEGPMTPRQRLSRAAALRAVTVNGAYQLRQEKLTGSLRAGMFADLIVLDREVTEVPEEEIAGAKVLLTMVGGRIVHGGTDLK
ncbi:amidohydrolase [Streptomyces sp. ODS05-4]|uniref:amidohydrolase n=1 Tax=Streptomyces sp. ODS05-4 TaxID=2944939 RepID=UPI002109E82B|nr:amidohydrolase [Streptomyces sp. ODS05-4]